MTRSLQFEQTFGSNLAELLDWSPICTHSTSDIAELKASESVTAVSLAK
jgi:hypothetical protein